MGSIGGCAMGWGVASFLLISWDDLFFPRERLGNISGNPWEMGGIILFMGYDLFLVDFFPLIVVMV